MTAPEPRRIRRDAIERLAAAVRALADAAAETDVEPGSLDDITAEIAALTQRLAAVTSDSPYSGLTWAPGDFSVPEGPMPLNPIIGACSPVRPDVELRYSEGEIAGRAVFTRRFVGPPGFAHGGISAMLGDQIVSASPGAIGLRTITKSLARAVPAAARPRRGSPAVGCLRTRGRLAGGSLHHHRTRRGRGRGQGRARAVRATCTTRRDQVDQSRGVEKNVYF